MKTIMTKTSIIMLSLLASTFTFVLGTTSSKAVSDETSFQQCIAQVTAPSAEEGQMGFSTVVIVQNKEAITQMISCANQQ